MPFATHPFTQSVRDDDNEDLIANPNRFGSTRAAAKPKQQKQRDPFGRLPHPVQPDPEIENIKNPSVLNDPVGVTGKNKRRDVAKVETLLGNAGTLDLNKTDGPTGYGGMRTEEATKTFQKQNGLQIDGQINPQGETIKALGTLASKALGQVAGALSGAFSGGGQAGGSAPDTGAARAATLQPPQAQPVAQPAPPPQATPQPSTPSASQPPVSEPDTGYTMPAEDVAANGRAAKYLGGRKGIGDYATFVAAGIETNPNQGIVETLDLYNQTKAINPAQADALINDVAPKLSGQNRTRLQHAMTPEPVKLNIDGAAKGADSSEDVAIGIWRPGGDHKASSPDGDQPDKGNFGDSATDDETPADDHPYDVDNSEFNDSATDDDETFNRDQDVKADFFQHLVEGGMSPEDAQKFIDKLPNYEPGTTIGQVFIDALTWAQDFFVGDPEHEETIIEDSVGGTR